MHTTLADHSYDKVFYVNGSQVCFDKHMMYTLEGIEHGKPIAVRVFQGTIDRLKKFQFNEPYMTAELGAFFLDWALYSIEAELPEVLLLFSDKEKITMVGCVNGLLLGSVESNPKFLAMEVF